MSAHQQPASTPAEPHRVTVDHVKTPSEDIVVVDVREPEELTAPGAMTFPGAVNYPLGPLLRDRSTNSLKHNLATKKEIVTLCNGGYRSGIAAQQLAAFGFNAGVLDGQYN
eukprot:gene5724-7258_t